MQILLPKIKKSFVPHRPLLLDIWSAGVEKGESPLPSCERSVEGSPLLGHRAESGTAWPEGPPGAREQPPGKNH